MNYSIDKNKELPAYIQLYLLLRKDIVSCVYPFGTRLPSKRTLADETGTSVVTAEHAYLLLIDEGYIESRERSGYYVIFRNEDGFAGGSTESYRDEILFSGAGSAAHDHLSAIEQDTVSGNSNHVEKGTVSFDHDTFFMGFPFSVLAKTMRGVLSEHQEKLFSRSPNEGLWELRFEISRYLARSRGIAVNPEQIVIGSGAEYLYNQIIGLLGREKIYGIEAPSYIMIENIYRIAGVRYERLPLTPDGIDSQALKNSKAGVLHITPYRSFPSGVSASASKRHEYLRWAEKDGRYIVEDDYDSEFSVLKKPEDTLFARSDSDNVIYLNTFSKSISPSLRVGYMLLPEHLLDTYKEKLGFFSCPVPTAMQYVLAELIRKGDFERHINRVRRAKRKGAK